MTQTRRLRGLVRVDSQKLTIIFQGGAGNTMRYAVGFLSMSAGRSRRYRPPAVGANQAAAAVVVVDASLSMDYQSGGKSRLDDAKQRALELLDEFSENSRVAVVDTSDPTREWMSVAQAREKVRGLSTKAGSQAVTTAMPGAYALFDELDRESTPGETEALPRFIYVVSDRTAAAWDSGRVPDLVIQRDRQPAPGVTAYFIDVGVEKPADVAIMAVTLKP